MVRVQFVLFGVVGDVGEGLFYRTYSRTHAHAHALFAFARIVWCLVRMLRGSSVLWCSAEALAVVSLGADNVQRRESSLLCPGVEGTTDAPQLTLSFLGFNALLYYFFIGNPF